MTVLVVTTGWVCVEVPLRLQVAATAEVAWPGRKYRGASCLADSDSHWPVLGTTSCIVDLTCHNVILLLVSSTEQSDVETLR